MKRTLYTLGLATMLAGALAPSSAAVAAFVSLPPNGAQVNDDPTNDIDPDEDAGLVDVTGGTVVAGNKQVPWATFEQKLGSWQEIFVRAFKNGAWVTQGSPASLNIDPRKVAEGPSIDFAGAGRTVPWVSWYEPNIHFDGEPTNIFASRFNAGANRWLPSGQDRTAGANVPSLNIHTNRTAENPSVAGGATIAGNDPVPWIVWEENDGGDTDDDSPRQIFVSKGVKQAAAGTPCAGFKPSAANNLNGFCFQQVGLDRLDSGQQPPEQSNDPSLNIDPTRAGVEPDIAFTGKDDTVVWTVWYEEDRTSVPGLRSNQMVFAAKAVADATADGGFHWVAVGRGTTGQTNLLDSSGSNRLGPCAESQASEDACSLNVIPGNDAENPRVAAGTMTAGQPTVPWVVWEESNTSGRHGVFVARLAGGDHFALLNGGQPISNPQGNASRPDITFAGNTPYVSWQEEIDTNLITFVGHFEGPATAPTFRLDTPGGIDGSALADPDNPQRAPISSTCTANPTNADGATCQGGAVGTPFFLFTAGKPGEKKLFARAFGPSDVLTLDATDPTSSSATLHGSTNPGGTSTLVHFDFGATVAYGSTTPVETLGVGVVPTPFDAPVNGLASGSTIHYRAVAASDFTSVTGPDQTVTAVNQPPAVSVEHLETELHLHNLGRQRALSLTLDIDEPAMATVQLLNRKHKVVREVTVSPSSAALVATLSLKHIHPGKFTLHVVAVDAEGATSAPIDLPLRVRR